MMLSFNCDRSQWKSKIVLLNFQNIKTDNFNLAKYLRNTGKGVYGLTKKRTLSKLFLKYIAHSIWKILPVRFQDTLSKFPGGHPILNRVLKLNSKISAGKDKKKEIHRYQLILHRGAKQKLCLKNAEIL